MIIHWVDMTPSAEGVVAVPITKNGKVLVIWDGENKSKQERLGWDIEGQRKPIDGLRQFVGGVCEAEDQLKELVREAREETEIDFEAANFVPAGVGTLIDHQRANGEIMLVGVSIYWLVLNEEMELQLREKGAIDMDVGVILRERDRIIFNLMQNMERPHEI